MFEVRMRDGRRLRVVDRRTPEGGIVKTIWDLTDDERRSEELREARAAAEAASAAKSEFLSSMSHELRTPLNGILGFAQLMLLDRRDPLSARQKERVEQIFRGGEHLLRLIDDILDLSRIEAGRVSISLEPVDVREVLVEVRRTLEPIAARFKVRVELGSLPPDLPSVVADRTRFAQILMNFGSNGIKYNRPERQRPLRPDGRGRTGPDQRVGHGDGDPRRQARPPVPAVPARWPGDRPDRGDRHRPRDHQAPRRVDGRQRRVPQHAGRGLRVLGRDPDRAATRRSSPRP
jgi:signal transduction histidine kinase